MLPGPGSFREARDYWRRDVARNVDSTSKVTVRLFRLGQWLERDRRPHLAPARKSLRVVYATWCHVAGVELPTVIGAGPGLRLRHGARGTVIHPKTVIGADVTIFHGVTLGTRGRRFTPTIGDGVDLAPGCAVLGGVTVGDGAVVGANVVVFEDVPPKVRVAPARPRYID